MIEKRKRFRRKLFHGGLVIWILLWIFSGLVEVSLEFQSKGSSPKSLMFGHGSIGVITDNFSTCTLNRVVLNKSKFLWSKPKFRSHGKYLFRSFFGRSMVDFHDGTNLVFPIAGFIWIWLLVGWAQYFKKAYWNMFKNPGQLARIVVLASVPVFIFISERGSRRDSEYAECIIKIRNIQQAIRGHQGMNSLWTKDIIVWNEIFEYLNFDHKKCSRGGNYRLITHYPEIGVLAAECRDPEHQRRFKKTDTSGW